MTVSKTDAAEPAEKRRVGRPSLKAVRHREIVATFIDLVARDGLEKVSLDEVAAVAGLQRPALRHFVGNRDQLITAAVEELILRYADQARSDLGGSPDFPDLAATLFAADRAANQSTEDAAFFALLAEAERLPETRTAIKQTYDAMLSMLAAALRRSHPGAPDSDIRATAYAVACLVEQNAHFQRLGYPRTRGKSALSAALTLAERLG